MTQTRQARSPRRGHFALYAANAISAVGNQLSNLAIPWFVLQTTGSASQTGIAAAFSILPTVITAFFGGGIVDRLGYWRMSVIADAASGLAVALVPLLYAIDALSFPVLLALVFLGALLDAPGVTARQSMLPELAAAGGMRLERAASNIQVIERGALLLGAPLAGILVTANVLWLNAASFAVPAAPIASMIPAIQAAGPEESSETRYLEEVRTGLRFILRDRLILAIMLTVMMTNLLDTARFSVIFPVYADEVFGSAVALGLIFGLSGGGTVIGRWRMAGSATVFHDGPCSSGRSCCWPRRPCSWPPCRRCRWCWRSSWSAGSGRGQVFAMTAAGAYSAMLLGVLAAGYLLDSVGLPTTLLVVAVCYVSTTLTLLINPAVRDMDSRVSPDTA